MGILSNIFGKTKKEAELLQYRSACGNFSFKYPSNWDLTHNHDLTNSISLKAKKSGLITISCQIIDENQFSVQAVALDMLNSIADEVFEEHEELYELEEISSDNWKGYRRAIYSNSQNISIFGCNLYAHNVIVKMNFIWTFLEYSERKLFKRVLISDQLTIDFIIFDYIINSVSIHPPGR